MKNPKTPVTCEVYIDGRLHRVFYESKVIYTDAKGRFVRDQDRNKHYLGNKFTYKIEWKSLPAVKFDDVLNEIKTKTKIGGGIDLSDILNDARNIKRLVKK